MVSDADSPQGFAFDPVGTVVGVETKFGTFLDELVL